MTAFSSRGVARVAASLVVVAAALAAAVLLKPGAAEAQNIMAAPACQCSAPTAVPGMSMTVVHCVCGGVACVLSEYTGAGKTPLMQCVK
jgi:hypothetical protein